MFGNALRLIGSAGAERAGVAGLAAVVILFAAVAVASLVLDLSLGFYLSSSGSPQHPILR